MYSRTAPRSPAQAGPQRPKPRGPPDRATAAGDTLMEVTPLVPAGRPVIERYGQRRFRVAGGISHGPVLVFPDRTLSWSADGPSGVTGESLAPVIEHGG